MDRQLAARKLGLILGNEDTVERGGSLAGAAVSPDGGGSLFILV